MNRAFHILAEWERLNEGDAEERACFAAIRMQAHDLCLTEGRDALANRLRQSPLLSAYHLAEWFAWNWWRLRWEPRSNKNDIDWLLAHRMSNIGGGYVWPNITIFSDGERTALIAKASREAPEAPFRYINNHAAVMASADYETAVDDFVGQVLERLVAEGVPDSNLARLWNDVANERRDPSLARIRKLEALMGFDPDAADGNVLSRMVADAAALGTSAVEEIAADRVNMPDMGLPSADELTNIADTSGFAVRLGDMVRMAIPVAPQRGAIPAWQVGSDAAKALRLQEGLGNEPVSDPRLTRMLAVDPRILERDDAQVSSMSFALRRPDSIDRAAIVLRPRGHQGRRFELARLLGDRLLSASEPLSPATRAYTYRQKAQRAFAAELLSPFDAVIAHLHGDYSAENLSDIAAHFSVSELTVRTQLVNRKVLDREELDPEAITA